MSVNTSDLGEPATPSSRQPSPSRTYLYGVGALVSTEDLPSTGDYPEGIVSESAIELIRDDDLVYVTTQVPSSMFEGDVAEANLEDVRWLSPRVLRHDSVLNHAASTMPVLPMRFGTLFATQESLRQACSRHRAVWCQALEKLGDAREFDVRMMYEPAEVRDAIACESRSDKATPQAGKSIGAGAAFLQKRRQAQQADHARHDWLRGRSVELEGLMDGQGVPWRSMTVNAEPEPGESRTVSARWAVLLPPSSANAQLKHWEQALAPLQLVPRGPYLPYSFVPKLEPLPSEDA